MGPSGIDELNIHIYQYLNSFKEEPSKKDNKILKTLCYADCFLSSSG